MPNSSRLDLDSLNAPQREAVETVEGPLLVLAGAGTGKTRVITCRIAHLLQRDVPPEAILAMTFTNKAAREMKERVRELIRSDAGARVTVGTFHAFGARLLRRHIRKLGMRNDFQISSPGYQSGLVRTIISEKGMTGDGAPGASELVSRISKAKSALLNPEDLRGPEASADDEQLATVYEEYEKRLHAMNVVDFDDLLVLVLKLWKQNPDLLDQYRERYRYIMVDEYQDTNAVQFHLVRTLAGSRGNVCVVGDDDQSIYGWRGAEVGNILQFETHFPGAKVIRLEQNYRSTESILEAANAVIAHNRARHPKRLWSGHGTGERITVVDCAQEKAEATFVADMIRDLKTVRGCRYGDFAVLYRSNYQSRLVEEQLRKARIPYTIVGSRSFYQRKEILDAVSYLEAAVNPGDDLSLLRILNVPPRGIGDKTLEQLKHWQTVTGLPLRRVLVHPELGNRLSPAAAAGARDLHACLEDARSELKKAGNLAGKTAALLGKSGYLDGLGRLYKPRAEAMRRKENVDEFIQSIADFQEQNPAANVHDFLERFALLDDNDKEQSEDEQHRGVTLLTVHAAKGLEFPVVLVIGLEQGLFPHQQSLREQGLEEERRLFYVAVTRAREQVVLTHARRRRVKGDLRRRRPSRFLLELPEERIECLSAEEALKPAAPEVARSFLDQMKDQFRPPGA